ncbi:hypothetical protein MPSEU_001056300 [Mayamaea pseudoterrestris]|nr:hypothetical protein MPSEU_001056300 [Mayamaea pseudoterrestris]
MSCAMIAPHTLTRRPFHIYRKCGFAIVLPRNKLIYPLQIVNRQVEIFSQVNCVPCPLVARADGRVQTGWRELVVASAASLVVPTISRWSRDCIQHHKGLDSSMKAMFRRNGEVWFRSAKGSAEETRQGIVTARTQRL